MKTTNEFGLSETDLEKLDKALEDNSFKKKEPRIRTVRPSRSRMFDALRYATIPPESPPTEAQLTYTAASDGLFNIAPSSYDIWYTPTRLDLSNEPETTTGLAQAQQQQINATQQAMAAQAAAIQGVQSGAALALQNEITGLQNIIIDNQQLAGRNMVQPRPSRSYRDLQIQHITGVIDTYHERRNSYIRQRDDAGVIYCDERLHDLYRQLEEVRNESQRDEIPF